MRRAHWLRALRRWHARIGLWGAALGLAFGATGILLNHRHVLRIPVLQYERVTLHRPLPAPAPASAAEMERWLRADLGMEARPSRIAVEPPQTVSWEGQAARQPERWSIAFDGTRDMARAEYLVGNRFVKVERIRGNWVAALANTHKATGAGVAWVLLADSVAAGIIALSLSGLAISYLTRRDRLLAMGVAAGAIMIALVCGLAML